MATQLAAGGDCLEKQLHQNNSLDSSQTGGHNLQEAAPQNDSQTISIEISNVVASFATRCHLNLRRIAMEGMHVIYKRETGMVYMKIRKPLATASMWSSGKITCTGAKTEDDAKVSSRKFARKLQNMGFKVRFTNFRVVNVLGTCSLPFAIRIADFSRDNPGPASYEPELHPGVTYRIKEPKATLKIFSTGSITVTAPSVNNIEMAIHHIFPLVEPYQMPKNVKQKTKPQVSEMHYMPCNVIKKTTKKPQKHYVDEEFDSGDSFDSGESDDSFGSD